MLTFDACPGFRNPTTFVVSATNVAAAVQESMLNSRKVREIIRTGRHYLFISSQPQLYRD
ncbi:hypothetical protein CCR75_003984 [Bremia lactucae]|uniref:Uncharacterized protein n=1 Tax=Bremia lactucae TaxID=4779 RepID=A0A976FPC6_BRELC|nr:hypothetical protein CCR75_003984 [Bremia lactucae]